MDGGRTHYLCIFMVFTAIAVTPNDWWNLESGKLDANPANHIASMNLAFRKVMGQGLWIIIGSVIAFLVGQIIDVLIFHRIKKVTGEKGSGLGPQVPHWFLS